MTIDRAGIILWVILLIVGLWLAMHKPLWRDELCSQLSAIQGGPWGKILTGRVKELNNPPLFYLFQKSITSVIKLNFGGDLYKDLSQPIEKQKYFLYVYPKGQIILRLFPDIFMATAITLLVRYFWLKEGLMAGLMAFLSALSSGAVWRYWAEARPYSLWFLLTLVQAIVLIEIFSNAKISSKVKNSLAICHWLLAFSFSLGILQILIAQAVLFFKGKHCRWIQWWAGLLPVCLAGIFMGVRFSSNSSSQSMMAFFMDPVDMITQNFTKENFYLLFFYLTAYTCRQNWAARDAATAQRVWKGIGHLPNLVTNLVFSLLFLSFIYWRWPGTHGGVPVHSRHFVFLAALGVVLVPAMFSDLWAVSKGSLFWRFLFTVLFMVLLFSQFLEGFSNAWFQGYYY